MIKDQTHIVLIIDRSGSMESVKSDAIGGFNAFIDEQKAVPGNVLVSLILFDHERIKVYENLPLNQTYHLNDKTFVPRGSTALLDAMGITLKEVTERLDADPINAPERTLVVVLTDGQENSSQEYTRDAVKKLVEDMTAKGNFEVMYLSADINAFHDAGALGIMQANTAQYTSDAIGTQRVYHVASMNAISYRSHGKLDLSELNDEENKAST